VHGFVHLTETECRVVDHPYFQRLRHIRQNDVASFVYPSLNVTRFEHSLGCCHVAASIAHGLLSTVSEAVRAAYLRQLGFSGAQFEQTCRLYALLHDVGHLPFSHLFETGLLDFAGSASPNMTAKEVCADWFGPSDFAKPHEAFGYLVAKRILDDVEVVEPSVKEAVLKLLGKKTLLDTDPLRPLKLLVDSEVDADRIDSTARDGWLAGGEYGGYDIERLCSAVRLVQQDEIWGLGFSRKALSSLEGLLLDRYRTHTWIHFHHRVVAMKCAFRVLIARLLTDQASTIKDLLVRDGQVANDAWKFDDVWLSSQLREGSRLWTSEPEASALRACLHRDISRLHVLWKDRLQWAGAWNEVMDRASTRLETVDLRNFGRGYETWLDEGFREQPGWAGLRMRIQVLPFKPLDDNKLFLVEEATNVGRSDLRDASPLCAGLATAWASAT